MDKQTAKFIAALIQALPDVRPDMMQNWFENPERLKRCLSFLTDPVGLVVEGRIRSTTYLWYKESTTLAPTKGEVMLAEAGDVFTGYIDTDFKLLGTDRTSHDTDETIVDIYGVSKEGNYRTLFGSLSTDPHSLVLSQGQITEFAYRHCGLLRTSSHTTLFLFEVGSQLFVAHVSEHRSRLRVLVNHFDDHTVPSNYCLQIVVPKQVA
jgi:hypothetical protein